MSRALLLAVPVALALLARSSSGASGSALGARVVDVARRSLGEREIQPNRSPIIDAWVQAVGARPGAQWCAAFVSHVLRTAAAELGVSPPVVGSARAKGLMAQFQAADAWWTAAEVRARVLPPGAVLVWDRSEPAGTGPEGHTGIAELDGGDGKVTAIEGNTPWEDVRRRVRAKDDPRLLGAGIVGAA